MKIKRLACDGASLMYRGLLGGRDDENGYDVQHNGKTVHINSAIYGFDKVISYMHAILVEHKFVPVDVILVLEGKQNKAKRSLINLDYKSGEKKAPAIAEEFEKLKEMLTRFWLDLGAQVMSQDRAEGDDTLAWLAKHTEDDLMIASYDNDISALNGVNEYGANIEVWIDGRVGTNKYGTFSPHLITTYKALVGDTSDKIKGCSGFGEAAFFKFVNQYGEDGLQELHDMLAKSDLSPLLPLVMKPEHALVRKIFEQSAQVLNSFDLAKLRPEWVQTMKDPLHWQPGMVRQERDNDDPRFKKWYGKMYLVTGDLFDQYVKWALPRIAQSREIALDIETSGCDESDEWLSRQSKSGDADDAGVDVFGHTLTGLSITFGDNNQYSLYFSVDHADTVNCDSEKLRQFIAMIKCPVVIHNVSFELAVLYNEWGARQADNGFHGFLPNVLDTQLSCAYTDENVSRALKFRSATVLKYEQQTYKETTELSGFVGTLFPGGRQIALTEPCYETRQVGTGKFEPVFSEDGEQIGVGAEITKTVFVEVGSGVFSPIYDIDGVQTGEEELFERVVKTPPVETRRYRMNELPATHVTAYGCDDTITTIAHHNFNRLSTQLEHQWKVYLDVEIDAAYMHAWSFVHGANVSLEKLNELSALDDVTYSNAWSVVRQFLIENGWSGTVPPTYTAAITPAELKEAFDLAVGRPLDTAMRTMSKLVTFIREVEGEPLFAGLLEELLAGDGAAFTKYVLAKFKGEPVFNYGSSVQKNKLLYGVMKLPERVFNKPTDAMWKAGIKQGNVKADVLAISYAMRDATPEQKPVLEAMRLMGMVTTRRGLYYKTYPNFLHWRDSRVRSQHNQSQTNTRRASESKPNKTQLPKHPKVEGQEARFREVIVPHRHDAVIVSIDFKAQELRLLADYSQDPVMLSMYVGDDKRDQHHLTGLAIAMNREPQAGWTYEKFAAVLEDKTNEKFKFCKEIRNLAKKLNFTCEYLAMAPKVAMTLMISEEEAQAYMDAREALFTRAGEWKDETIASMKSTGTVTTMLGAVRHLRSAVTSDDRRKSSKAERQAVNFRIQSSSAEQTKLAEGRMWTTNLFQDFDARYYGPVHDECVCSVKIADLFSFIPRMHACMTARYADMQVPIEGDISFGPNFYKQIEIGPVPSQEAIEKGIAELQRIR